MKKRGRKHRKTRTPWSERELRQLKRLRAAGMSVPEMVAKPRVLAGRTRDAIAQQLRRRGWADPEKSQQIKNRTVLSPAAHAAFLQLLRNSSREPYDVIIESWNEWASQRGFPSIKPSLVQYWITKLQLPHSRQDVWKSEHSKTKRKASQLELHAEQWKALEASIEADFSNRRELANTYLLQNRNVEVKCCLLCENEWPLAKEFFSFLPSSFSGEGERLRLFQTGYCKECYRSNLSRIKFLRTRNRDTSLLIEQRSEYRRKGLDAAWELVKDKYRKKRNKLLREHPHLKRQLCVRCDELWPSEQPYFHRSRVSLDGSVTLRSLCAFCDNWYCREIDRRKRDSESADDLKAERSAYLARARVLKRHIA